MGMAVSFRGRGGGSEKQRRSEGAKQRRSETAKQRNSETAIWAKEKARRDGRRALVFLVDSSMAESESNRAIFFRKFVLILKAVTRFLRGRGLDKFSTGGWEARVRT